VHPDPAARQPPRHVAAHAAETVKTDFQHAMLRFFRDDPKYRLGTENTPS
jgi:hypothetical protein